MASLGLTFDILARDSASSTFKKVGTEAERAGSKIDNAMGAGLKKSLAIGAGALAGVGIVGFFKDTIGAASAAEQSVGGVQAVFKDYAKSVITDSKNADRAVGLSANSYRELATVIGAQLKNASVPMEELGQRTEDIIGIGSDLAAQFGGSTQEAVEALSSAFRGEMDPIEKYGISLNEASLKAKALELGLTDGKGPLDQHAKVMAGLAIVTEQSADAQGAFARESDTAAGRAARAAAQWDNLTVAIGDELLPAWSGLMDVLGTAVIPALGEVVGIVGGAIEVFGDLPGPVQAGATAFGLWAIGGGKVMELLGKFKTSGAGGVFDDLRLKMMYAKEEGEGLRGKIGAIGSTAGTVASGSLKSLARAIGPELGVAVAIAVISSVADSIHGIATAGDDARKEVDDLNDALDGSFGASQIGAVTSNIDTLRQSLEGASGELEDLQSTGSVLASAGNALSALELASDFMDASESVDVYRQALEEAEAKQAALDSTTQVLADRFHLSTGEVLALAEKYKIDLNGGVTDSARLLENFYSQEYGRKPTEASLDLADAMGEARTKIDAAKQAVDNYKLSLDILTGKTVSTIEVEAALEESIDAAKDAVKDLDGKVKDASGGLNLHSEAGRAASDVLLDIRDSGNQLISTMIDQGASTDEVTRKDQKLRESFIKSARQMGFSQDEARALADDILGIPAERETQIKADTTAAKDAVSGLQKGIDNLKGRTVTIGVGINAPSRISGENGRVGGFFAAKGGVFDYFANGGMREDHTAQIAPAGSWRVWAEPETGGEAYIPLAPSKRARSLKIWEETGKRLDAFADGGLRAPVSIRAELDARTYDSRMNSIAANVAKYYEPVQGFIGALQWAKSQVGKPYIWGGVGPAGFDCSGFMSAITNVIRGKNPYSRVGSTASFPWSGFASGLGSFSIGSTKNAGGGIGHMAGTLLGVNVESTGSVGVRMGAAARGATDGLFGTRAHLAMANGGVIGEPVYGVGLSSGRSYSFGERGPETVTPGAPGRGPMEITGRLVLDDDGFARIVDGRIVAFAEATANRGAY